MIIVAAHIQVKNGNEMNFINSANKCIAETRKEKGNISYNLLRNTEDDSKFTFFEEWESKESLDAHMVTDHFKQLGAEIGDLLAAPLDINIYESNKIN